MTMTIFDDEFRTVDGKTDMTDELKRIENDNSVFSDAFSKMARFDDE